MFQKNYLKIFIGLVWFCILGTFIAPHWLDPQLPADVLSELQKSYFYSYIPYINYILLSVLLIVSIGLWFSKKWGRSFLIGYILLTWIFQIFKGPQAVYSWYSLFSDLALLVTGIIAGISFADPINQLLVNKSSHLTLKKFRILILMTLIAFGSSFAAMILTDSSLPASFVRFSKHNNAWDIFLLMVVIIFLISLTSLLFRSKVAKYLFIIASMVINISFYPDALTTWDAFFGYIGIILQGSIIGILCSTTFTNEFSKLRNTNFLDASAICLIKFFDFSGRARRSEFFWFNVFCYWLIPFLMPTKLSATLLGLILIIPTFAVGARRLHDIGKSGWWQLLYIMFPIALIAGFQYQTMPWIGIIAIPAAIATIIILIYWSVKKGSLEKNQYGDPVL